MPGPFAQQIPMLSPTAKMVLPGVRGKTRKAIQCGEHVIAKGQDVIIQPLGDGQYQLTTFKKDESESHLPEAQRSIIPEQSFVTTLKEGVSDNDVFKYSEHYQFSNTPLFKDDGSPSLEEVNQSRIPNCFFLAVLQSIVAAPNGKGYLRDIMKQNDDGTTTVKLYNPRLLKVEYVTVPHAVLVDESGYALNTHKAMWVHVLESAYAAVQVKNAGVDEVESDASIASIFTDGGLMATASKTLLGTTSELVFITKPPSPWKISNEMLEEITKHDNMDLATFTREISNGYEILDAIGLVMNFEGELDETRQQSFDFFQQYLQFYQENITAIEPILNNTTLTDADKMMRMIDLDNSSDHRFAKFLANAINYENVRIDEMTVRREMDSFKGVYSETQMNTYNRIKEEISKGNIVSAGARSDIKKTIPGIVGSHAYSIFNVVEKMETGIDPETNEPVIRPVYYLQVKNPWGEYGRVYNQQGEMFQFEAGETDEDTFEVELSDFCKYYSTLHFSDNNAFRFENEHNQHKTIEKLTTIVDQTTPSNNPSLEKLVDSHQYLNGQFKTDVLSFERRRLEEFNPKIKDIFFELNSNQLNSKNLEITQFLDQKAADYLATAMRKSDPSLKPNQYLNYLNSVEEYLKTADGQQLLRLYKLDYLEKIEPKNEKIEQIIGELKEEITNHADNVLIQKAELASTMIKQSAQLYEQELNKKLEKFDLLATQVEEHLKGNDDDLTFDTYLDLHKVYIEMEEIHNSLTTMDPNFNNDKFNQAREAMKEAKTTILDIQTYKEMHAQKINLVVDILQQAVDYKKEGKISDQQKNEVDSFVQKTTTDIHTTRHLALNSDLPKSLGKLLSGLHKIKKSLSNLVSGIKTSIKRSIGLWRGKDYMLGERQKFDKDLMGTNDKQTSKQQKSEVQDNVALYKRMLSKLSSGKESPPDPSANNSTALMQ